MYNTWMQNNYAGLDGGAMHIESTIQLSDLQNITMTTNHAKSFGGAVNEVGSNITFVSSSVTKNTADLYGGGLFTFFAGMYMFHTDVIGNR